MGQLLWKLLWQSHEMVTIELPSLSKFSHRQIPRRNEKHNYRLVHKRSEQHPATVKVETITSPPADGWWTKCGVLHTVEYYWAVKRNEGLIHVTNKRMDVENIMLSERCHTQKVTYYVIPLISSVQNRQIQRESRFLVTRKGGSGVGRNL